MFHKHIMVTGEAGHGKDTVANYFAENYGYRTIAFADLQKQEVIASYAKSIKPVDLEWLTIRETKETPDYRLALENCIEKNFVEIALEAYESEDRLLHSQIKNGEVIKNLDDSLARTIRNQSKSIAAGKDSFSLPERLCLPRSPRRITQVWGTEFRRLSRFGHDRYWIDPVDKIVRESREPYAVTDGRTLDEISWGSAAGLQRIEVVRPSAPRKVATHVTEMIPAVDHRTIVLMNDSSLQELYDKIDKHATPHVVVLAAQNKMRLTP